jgi:hypothetical protein
MAYNPVGSDPADQEIATAASDDEVVPSLAEDHISDCRPSKIGPAGSLGVALRASVTSTVVAQIDTK